MFIHRVHSKSCPKTTFLPVFVSICLFLICSPLKASEESSYASVSVDIGVFYTEDVLKSYSPGELHAMVERRTDLANSALVHSNIPLRRHIAVFESSPVPQSRFRKVSEFLKDKSSIGAFSGYIDRFGLDYITVLVRRDDSKPGIYGCGVAQVGGRVSIVYVSEACNVKAKDYVFAHEWGHLDGAAHDVRTAGKARKKYGVGYDCNGFRTVMNTNTFSADKGLFYSQGDTCGKDNVADVARMIRERMHEKGAILNVQAKMPIAADIELVPSRSALKRTGRTFAGLLQLSHPVSHLTSVQLYTSIAREGSMVDTSMRRVIIAKGKASLSIEQVLPVDQVKPGDNMAVGIRYPEHLNVTSEPIVLSVAAGGDLVIVGAAAPRQKGLSR